MKKTRRRTTQEMVSLNQALFSFDSGNLSAEEIERCLERATQVVGSICQAHGCPNYYVGGASGSGMA